MVLAKLSLQDIAVMRSIPNMSVYQPATAIETKILEYSIRTNKPIYIKFQDKLIKNFTSSYKFKPFIINKNFKDGIVISSGNTLQNSYEAVEKLNMLGKKIGLINIPSIKPLNKSKIKNLLEKQKNTVEIIVFMVD